MQVRKEDFIITISAGVGRSGTTIAFYNIAQLIREYLSETKEQSRCSLIISILIDKDFKECKISIFSIVRRLREERNFMVQTKVNQSSSI